MPPPSAPIIQSRPRTGDSTITFWWGPPVNNGGHPIQSYRFFDGTTFTDVPPNGSPYTVTGVPNGVDLEYYIAASNGYEYSPFVAFQSVQAGDKPGPPRALSALATDPGSTLLSWTPPQYNGGATIRWYVATVVPITGGSPSKFSLLGSSTSGTLSGLDSTKSYRVLLQAVNDPGYSPPTSFAPTLTWGFQPTDLSDTLLWIDASDPTSLLADAGTPVYSDPANLPIISCLNKAPAATAPFQADGAPSISLTALGFICPAIVFTGSTTLTGSVNRGSNEKSLFLVFTAAAGPILRSNNGSFSIELDASSNLVVTGCCPVSVVPLFRPSNATLLRVLITETTVSASIVSPETGVEVIVPRNGRSLENLGLLVFGAGNCSISEALLFDSALSNPDALNVQSYLIQKWALSTKPLPPSFVIEAAKSSVSQYTLVSLSAYNAGGPYTYQSDSWAVNDLELAENTHGTYLFRPLTIGVSEIVYSVDSGTETYISSPFLLTVLPLIGSSAPAISLGTPVDLLVDLTSNTDYSNDAWYLDGQEVAKGTNGALLGYLLPSRGSFTFTYTYVSLSGESYTSVPIFIQVS